MLHLWRRRHTVALTAGTLFLHSLVLAAHRRQYWFHLKLSTRSKPDDAINWELIRLVNSSDNVRDPDSRSEFGQDTWVLSLFDQPGVYLDIGANNAEHLSNTFMLDKHGWNGWCVDPFPSGDYRCRRCELVEAAISGASGTAVNFSRPRDGALGGIQDTLGLHRGEVASATVVPLGTLGIRDLLQQHGVPQHIHYLSLDVEGHELEVLKAWPWHSHRVDLITVEHNFEDLKRAAIAELLNANGLFLSWNVHVDDWFATAALLSQ